MEQDQELDEPYIDLGGTRYRVSAARMDTLRAAAERYKISIEEAWAAVLVSERL